MIYIIIDDKNNIIMGPCSTEFPVPSGLTMVEAEEWPTIDGKEPYLKKDLMWNGKEIVFKSKDVLLAESNAKKIAELKKHIYENWLDSGKTQDEIKKQFKTIEKSILSKKSVDVSDEIKNFKKWMEEK